MSVLVSNNGFTKSVATGFSWKFLFFGWLYSIVRGDIRGFIIQFLIDIFVVPTAFWFGLVFGATTGSTLVGVIIVFLAIFSYPMARIIVALNLNENYLIRLAERGWSICK